MAHEVAVQQAVDQKAAYKTMNARSAKVHQEAQAYMPGGSTRMTAFIDPHPFYIDRAEGAYLYDIDGNRRLDLNNNFTAIILGHANKKVAEAAAKQALLGTSYGMPNELEVQLAKMVTERYPSFERVRFCNSGTEATLNALRVAKAYTGKTKFAKFEGGYHGSHDYVEVSIAPPTNETAGPDEAPSPVLDQPGISGNVNKEVIILPWNDAAAVERLVRENKDELAAVIAEPIIGSSGMLAPEPGFLQELRRITQENGVLLIFDEVISLRLGPNGGQEYYGVRGDLVTTGKIIGGGLPIGAFGGRADIMDLYNPHSDKRIFSHAGTFTANPMTMAAGVAAMEQFTPQMFEKINRLGERLRTGLATLFKEAGIPAQVTGVGSLFGLHITSHAVKNYRDTMRVDAAMHDRLWWWLLNNGVLPVKPCRGSLNADMEEKDVDFFLGVVKEFLAAEKAQG